MNDFTKLLVNDLLEQKTQKVTAIYGGGFKPPTKGHFNVVQKAAEQNPEIDDFIIYIGGGVRDSITQGESIQIWDLYKKYLPMKVRVEPVKSPIGDILRYAKEHLDETVLWVIGARENNPEDFADIASRTRTMEKYPNLQLRIIQTQGGVSGTAARKAIQTNNKEQFFNLIPDIEEKEQVWGIVSNLVNEGITDKNPNAVKFWALYYNIFQSLKTNPDRNYSILSKKLKGEHKEALDYFYDEFFKDGNQLEEASDPQAGTALPYGSGFSPLEEAWNPQEVFVTLSKYMIDNGMQIKPLPKIKVIKDDEENASDLLGKTAYYDPNEKSITLFTMNRHPKDILRSFAHEMVHHEQNLNGKLTNIQTTNTNEDGALPDIEREAYEKGNMMLRNWEDSIKAEKYLKEYKQKALTELFEKDLPIIDKVSKNLYIVTNGGDIEAKYDFRMEIPERNIWSMNWFFTPNNKNESPEAWKQITATSFKVLEDWLKTNNPKSLHISGNTDTKTSLYKNYIDKLEILLNNRYKIDNSDEYSVVLRSIEEAAKSNIKKRMETLNESYEQALSYWQNGNTNSKSKIERWSSIKRKLKREVLQELYNINIPSKEYFLDISKFNQPKTFVDELHESLNEITLSKDNAVEINGDLTGGKFNVGDKTYEYSIKNLPNPYNDLGTFYNIAFTPEEKSISTPTSDTDPKDYIKILSTMYKIIVDFAEKEKPEYIGIASLDNTGDKNYHRIYATLTDNKYNRIPGYFRKDVNLGFNSEAGRGRMIVLKRKNV
jgi:hypothetical protein